MSTNNMSLMRELRIPMPPRRLEPFEAEGIAERQTMKLLERLDQTEMPVDLTPLLELPRIEVRVDSRLAILRISGLSEWSNGRWVITINKADAPTRRRFSLAHEFKHVLDHPFVHTLYPHYADEKNPEAERICDYFAACLLMPRPWVKQLWTAGIQDVDELAARFRVSPAAMVRRLEQLGLIDRQARYGNSSDIGHVRRYFRRSTLAPLTSLAA